MNPTKAPRSLDEVIWTRNLSRRKARSADRAREALITMELMHDLVRAPEEFFPKLVRAILDLTGSESAGISLLDAKRGRFVWPAVEGGLEAYVGSGTPSSFGPCGTVLEHDAPVLFVHPQDHFTYLQPITPPLEEVLLAPFRADGRPVGTLWAVMHKPGRQFDGEDRRLLENLAEFAASSYRALVNAGQLETLLESLPGPPAELLERH